MRARARERNQRRCAEDLQPIANQNNFSPVEAIRNMSRGQQEKQAGQKQRQSRVSEIERPVGDRVHLPGNRH